jgi:hypothetical protein
MRKAKSILTGRRLGIALAATVMVTASDARGHEDAVLRSPASAIAAGDTLPLSGADFSPSSTYELQLLGALREYELRRIEIGPEGTFDLALPIPSDVAPGVYKLVAVAPDGDRVAGLDLTVLEPTLAATDSDGEPKDDDASGQTEMREMARADEIPIERSRSGAEWGVIGLVVGLAAGFGIMLIRRS